MQKQRLKDALEWRTWLRTVQAGRPLPASSGVADGPVRYPCVVVWCLHSSVNGMILLQAVYVYPDDLGDTDGREA